MQDGDRNYSSTMMVIIISEILVRVQAWPRMAKHNPEPKAVPVLVWVRPRTRPVLTYTQTLEIVFYTYINIMYNMYGSYVRMKFGSTRKKINGAQIIVLTISSNCYITIRKAHPRSRSKFNLQNGFYYYLQRQDGSNGWMIMTPV